MKKTEQVVEMLIRDDQEELAPGLDCCYQDEGVSVIVDLKMVAQDEETSFVVAPGLRPGAPSVFPTKLDFDLSQEISLRLASDASPAAPLSQQPEFLQQKKGHSHVGHQQGDSDAAACSLCLHPS